MYWQMGGNSFFVGEKLHPDFTVEIFVKSTNLKPIKSMMDRCSTGTMVVVFDNVQVMVPVNFLRTISGLNLVLR